MKNGWSQAEAFALPDDLRTGFCIALGEMEGGEFDWHAMAFKEPT